MVGRTTTAEKLVVVNIVLLAVCLGLLVLCVIRRLWFPGAFFAVLSFSNGFQLWTAKHSADRPPHD